MTLEYWEAHEAEWLAMLEYQQWAEENGER